MQPEPNRPIEVDPNQPTQGGPDSGEGDVAVAGVDESMAGDLRHAAGAAVQQDRRVTVRRECGAGRYLVEREEQIGAGYLALTGLVDVDHQRIVSLESGLEACG